MKPQKLLIISVLLLIFSSCTKDVDFDQIDNASIETSYILTLVNANFTALDFLNEVNEEIPLTLDYIKANVDDSGQDYLEKIEITVETENSFSRSFYMSFQMYDLDGNLIYTVSPTVTIYANSNNTVLLEIPTEDLHYLYEAYFFGFTFILPETTNSNNTIETGTTGELNLKSSMELFFNFRKI